MVHFRHVLLPLFLVSASFGQEAKRSEEPPVANRAEPFSGAVGRKFSVAMHADRTELQVGDTLQLTIRVEAEDTWQRPPQRPDLRRHEKYARFPRGFQVENAGEKHEAAPPVWEFVYRLRPLNDTVTEIPRLPWVYYRPSLGYQTLSAPAIRLRVEPRRAVSATDVQGSVATLPAPEALPHLVEGEDVLRREEATVLPAPFHLLLVVLLPPVVGACWYVHWRRWNPEAARLAQLRRSRAARTALDALQRCVRQAASKQAAACAAVLAEYLHARFGLTVAEPTPAEISVHLQGAGLAPATAAAAAGFFRACDGVRFAGDSERHAVDWLGTARQLILTLEAAACSLPSR